MIEFLKKANKKAEKVARKLDAKLKSSFEKANERFEEKLRVGCQRVLIKLLSSLEKEEKGNKRICSYKAIKRIESVGQVKRIR